MNDRTDGRTDGRTDEQTDERTSGRTDGRARRWAVLEKANGSNDGQTDRRAVRARINDCELVLMTSRPSKKPWMGSKRSLEPLFMQFCLAYALCRFLIDNNAWFRRQGFALPTIDEKWFFLSHWGTEADFQSLDFGTLGFEDVWNIWTLRISEFGNFKFLDCWNFGFAVVGWYNLTCISKSKKSKIQSPKNLSVLRKNKNVPWSLEQFPWAIQAGTFATIESLHPNK